MKVCEILKMAAAHIGRNDLKEFISSPTEDDGLQEEAENLLIYYNAVEKELASDYFPLLTEETFETDTGEIFYGDFERPPVAIRGIYLLGGGRAESEFFSDHVRTAKGKLRVVYSFLPADKALDDECEKFYGVPDLALVAGVAKGYCLAAGMSAECTMWNKTYYDCIQSARAHAAARRRISARRWA